MCSEVGTLEGNWIMGALYSSVDSSSNDKQNVLPSGGQWVRPEKGHPSPSLGPCLTLLFLTAMMRAAGLLHAPPPHPGCSGISYLRTESVKQNKPTSFRLWMWGLWSPQWESDHRVQTELILLSPATWGAYFLTLLPNQGVIKALKLHSSYRQKCFLIVLKSLHFSSYEWAFFKFSKTIYTLLSLPVFLSYFYKNFLFAVFIICTKYLMSKISHYFVA